MPITDLLEENAKKYGSDVCLVEVNPQIQETPRMLWKEPSFLICLSCFRKSSRVNSPFLIFPAASFSES